MEMHDNSNVDAGIEDVIMKETLYERLMDVF